jgi:hypothetical protein
MESGVEVWPEQRMFCDAWVQSCDMAKALHNSRRTVGKLRKPGTLNIARKVQKATRILAGMTSCFKQNSVK